MKKFAALAVGLMLGTGTQAAPPISHFPEKNLGEFLAQRFDLASIRSSFGPRRTPAQRSFADFGMKPSKATEDQLVFDSPGDWLYEMKIVGRRDVNGDGIEDLEICFTDRAQNGGTYDSVQGLLVTRYSLDRYALALGYALPESVCGDRSR